MARIRLLSQELETQRQVSAERTRSIDSKAAFLVIAAGLVAGATVRSLSDTAFWYLALIPLTLALATVIAATVALWPTKIDVVSARGLTDEWIDHSDGPDELEDHILEVKTREIEARDERNEARAGALKTAFWLLAASVVSVMATALIDGMV